MSSAPRMPSIVEHWRDAWNAPDPQAMGALFTPDGTYEDLAFQVTSTGRQAVAEWVRVTRGHMPDLHVDVADAFQVGDRIAVRWTSSATPVCLATVPGTGKRFSVPAASLWEVPDGRIATARDYYNLADLLRQLGLPAGPYVPRPLR